MCAFHGQTKKSYIKNYEELEKEKSFKVNTTGKLDGKAEARMIKAGKVVAYPYHVLCCESVQLPAVASTLGVEDRQALAKVSSCQWLAWMRGRSPSIVVRVRFGL